MKGEAVSNQPAWVAPNPRSELPEPVFETIHLAPFAENRELTPTTIGESNLMMEFYNRWILLSADSSKTPHVYTLDFTDINAVRPASVSNTLGSFLRLNHGRARRCYLRLEGIASTEGDGLWTSIHKGLESLGQVAVARRARVEECDLIGNDDKRLRYRDPLNELAKTAQWVPATLFSQARLGESHPNLLKKMHADGVIIRHSSHWGTTFYRSLV